MTDPIQTPAGVPSPAAGLSNSLVGITVLWTVATSLGTGLALLLAYALEIPTGQSQNPAISAALPLLLAVLVPLAQLPVLRLRLRRPWGWLVATILGWAAGLGLVFLSFVFLPHQLYGSLLSALFIISLCVGLAQWLYLRSRLAYAEYWVPATMAGYALAALVAGHYFSSPWALEMLGVIPGLLTGLVLGALFTSQPAAPARS